MPRMQLNRSASRTHAPLPGRPVPPVCTPLRTLGNRLLWTNGGNQEWAMHAMLGHGLTTLVAASETDGDEYLPQVLLAIRTRTHAVTWVLAILPTLWHTPSTPQRRNTPRSSLMPLDEIERMEENSEFIARNLEEVGQARSAANVRTKAQAEAMRKRNNFDENTSDYYFKVGDMVKMKHHDRQKLEFNWKGPYHVCRCWPSRTYWIMTPQGLRLPKRC
ncbi:hypothetical protein BASA83_013039 [Batrachochytrium salamandrivorans]|nr:hypothetical protein BASA83_013039 [Batrachochytrium salamandrivorans]